MNRLWGVIFVVLATLISVSFLWSTADAVAGTAIDAPTTGGNISGIVPQAHGGTGSTNGSTGNTTGFWANQCITTGTACTNTPPKAFAVPVKITTLAGLKFRNITCQWGGAGTGGTTGFQITVRNITDASDLCTCTLAACTATANAPVSCDCNTAPLAGKAYNLLAAGDCATNPSDVTCTVEVTQ